MFLANLIFVVSYLKIHPAVHLNILKALKSLQSESILKIFSFRFSYIVTRIKKS